MRACKGPGMYRGSMEEIHNVNAGATVVPGVPGTGTSAGTGSTLAR